MFDDWFLASRSTLRGDLKPVTRLSWYQHSFDLWGLFATALVHQIATSSTWALLLVSWMCTSFLAACGNMTSICPDNHPICQVITDKKLNSLFQKTVVLQGSWRNATFGEAGMEIILQWHGPCNWTCCRSWTDWWSTLACHHCHGGSPPELSFFLGRTSFPRTSGPSGLVSFPWDSLLLSTEFRLFVCASLEIWLH